jgi:predicted XRE-type DNA-binding protein
MKDKFSSFEEGFSATIKGISLFDYLQLLIMTQKTKTIEVRSHNLLGVIQILIGKVIFSKTSDGKEGNDAFCEIMSWKNGVFKDIEVNRILKENVQDRGNLLLQATEYIDNLENGTPQNLPPTKELLKCVNSAINNNNLKQNEEIATILEYNQNSKELSSELCENFEPCSLFKNCRSEGIKNMWIRVYCKSSKKLDCKRFILLNKNKEVSEMLLPNGNFLE